MVGHNKENQLLGNITNKDNQLMLKKRLNHNLTMGNSYYNQR